MFYFENFLLECEMDFDGRMIFLDFSDIFI